MKLFEVMLFDVVYLIILNNIISIRIKRMEIGYLEGIFFYLKKVC